MPSSLKLVHERKEKLVSRKTVLSCAHGLELSGTVTEIFQLLFANHVRDSMYNLIGNVSFDYTDSQTNKSAHRLFITFSIDLLF